MPWHACPFDKNTAWSTEFPCCSPSRLERFQWWWTLLRSPSFSRGQFRARLKPHLFTQAYEHLWELLLKSVFFYIYVTHILCVTKHYVGSCGVGNTLNIYWVVRFLFVNSLWLSNLVSLTLWKLNGLCCFVR